jgi:septal ring factor EnvC (AmiA/AmiB activator)
VFNITPSTPHPPPSPITHPHLQEAEALQVQVDQLTEDLDAQRDMLTALQPLVDDAAGKEAAAAAQLAAAAAATAADRTAATEAAEAAAAREAQLETELSEARQQLADTGQRLDWLTRHCANHAAVNRLLVAAAAAARRGLLAEQRAHGELQRRLVRAGGLAAAAAAGAGGGGGAVVRTPSRSW